MFKVLGLETRLKIIHLLRTSGPLGPKRMAAELGITTAAVSQHLRTLRQAGLVRATRRGCLVPYTLDETALEDSRRALDQVCRCECGHGHRQRVEPAELQSLDIETLRQYDKALRDEIVRVGERIKQLEKTIGPGNMGQGLPGTPGL
jgi:DNA-binding transcriptional ArsR family regulator